MTVDSDRSESTMRNLLTRGNTAAVVVVNAIDLLRHGARDVNDQAIVDARDALDAWARDVRASSSEFKP
jgi:hypothetical protein